MEIEGKKREQREFISQKYVGLFEGKVVAINPTAEEFKDLMGYEPKEDSKQFDYLGESDEGNVTLRVDVWLEEVKEREKVVVEEGEDVVKKFHEKFKVSFFLENKDRENKDKTKTQYINAAGSCSWADDPNNLPEWFLKSEYRVAKTGEENLYGFVQKWLGNLDFRSPETNLYIDNNWKKFMKGNVKPLREEMGGEWETNVVALAVINAKDVDGEVKEYQRVYNNRFLDNYSLRYFRNVDFEDSANVEKLRNKKPRDLKDYERFVLEVKDPVYGCKDYFELKPLDVYTGERNLAATDKVIAEDDASY